MNKIVYSQQTMFLHRTRYKNDFPFLLPLHKEQAARIPKRSRDTLFICLTLDLVDYYKYQLK